MEYVTRVALKPESGYAFRILELGTRQTEESNTSFPYADYMTTKGIRSNRRAQRDIVKILKKLARLGKSVFRHPDQYRDVGPTKQVLELKPDNHRLLLFRHSDDWLILDAFKKPSDKVQSQKIKSADDLRIAYLRSLSQSR